MPDPCPTTPGGCNCEELDDAFKENECYINQEIAVRANKHVSFWRDMIEKGTYVLGEGYVQSKVIFHGGIASQDNDLVSWVPEEKSRPANPQTNDAGYDACKYECNMVGHGFETRTFQLYRTCRRTADLCLLDIEHKWQFKKQIDHQYDNLANITLGEWEQWNRRTYIGYTTKFLAAPGLPNFGTAMPNPVGYQVGRLTQEILDRLYMFIAREAHAFALSNTSGAPVFGLITSMETSQEIIESDPRRLTDQRYINGGEFLMKGYGSVKEYRNFLHMHDMFTPRFKLNAAGTGIEPVYPYKVTPITVGEKANISQEYINAPYEQSTIFMKDVFRNLFPPSMQTVGGATEFDPQNWFGDFFWLNIQDRCENPLRQKGYYMGVYRVAPEPGTASDLAISIIHRRCFDQNLIQVCSSGNCDQPASLTEAITVNSCALIDPDEDNDAFQVLLNLAKCPLCTVGQSITVTFADDSVATAVIADDSAASVGNYVISFATADNWCENGGGIATVACAA